MKVPPEQKDTPERRYQQTIPSEEQGHQGHVQGISSESDPVLVANKDANDTMTARVASQTAHPRSPADRDADSKVLALVNSTSPD